MLTAPVGQGCRGILQAMEQGYALLLRQAIPAWLDAVAWLPGSHPEQSEQFVELAVPFLWHILLS